MIRYTIDQSQPDYTDSFSLSILITDSFLATFICYQISRAGDYAFFICTDFASDRIRRVYEHSINMAKARFGCENIASINTAIEKLEPENTKRNKSAVWKQFSEFCIERSYKIDATSTEEQIALILQDWAYNMRKKNGENYKETVIKMMWNVNRCSTVASL